MNAAAGVAGVAIFCLWMAAAVWVFVDAEEHSSQSTARWGAVALLFGFTGALIYWFVGRDEIEDDRRTAYENP